MFLVRRSEKIVVLYCIVCAMHHSNKAFYRTNRREQSRVPILKKPSLDPLDLNSYRPISNLSFVSKMVERIVDSRLIAYLTPEYQSAYRRNHSTETALVRLYNDMIQVIDSGQVGALVLLDMSAAFDTVDHQPTFSTIASIFER